MYSNPLPLSGLTIIDNPTDVTIQIEERKVKFDDSVTSKSAIIGDVPRFTETRDCT